MVSILLTLTKNLIQKILLCDGSGNINRKNRLIWAALSHELMEKTNTDRQTIVKDVICFQLGNWEKQSSEQLRKLHSQTHLLMTHPTQRNNRFKTETAPSINSFELGLTNWTGSVKFCFNAFVSLQDYLQHISAKLLKRVNMCKSTMGSLEPCIISLPRQLHRPISVYMLLN